MCCSLKDIFAPLLITLSLANNQTIPRKRKIAFLSSQGIMGCMRSVRKDPGLMKNDSFPNPNNEVITLESKTLSHLSLSHHQFF